MYEWLSKLQIWEDANIKSACISLVVTAITELVRRIITPRANVVWGRSHQHFFIVPGPQSNINIRTRQIFVQNIGRTAAEEIEITFNYKPEHFDVWPPTIAKTEVHDRFLIIKVANLNRREFFTVDLINHAQELPELISARWKGGVSKQRTLGTFEVKPTWVLRLIAALLILGAFSACFLVVRIVLALP